MYSFSFTCTFDTEVHLTSDLYSSTIFMDDFLLPKTTFYNTAHCITIC